MNNRKAAGFRTASRWIGYGGLLACAVAAVIGYIVRVIIHNNPLLYYQIAGKNVFPKGIAPMAMLIAAVICIVAAIVLRILAANRAKTADLDLLDTMDAEESAEDDSAYIEEPIAPVIESAGSLAAIAAPAGETVSVSDTPAVQPAPSKVLASFEVRVPSDPAKEAKKAEKKAKRAEKTSKVKASIGKTVDKAFPPEKREAMKKKVESVKRAAKVIIPVAVTCVVVAKVAKKRKQKKQEKEKARNRQQFYQWLG